MEPLAIVRWPGEWQAEVEKRNELWWQVRSVRDVAAAQVRSTPAGMAPCPPHLALTHIPGSAPQPTYGYVLPCYELGEPPGHCARFDVNCARVRALQNT